MNERKMRCSGSLASFNNPNDRGKCADCAELFKKSKYDALILIGLSPLLVKKNLADMGIDTDVDYTLIYRANKKCDSTDEIPSIISPYENLAVETWRLFKQVIENPDLEPQCSWVDDEIFLDAIARKASAPLNPARKSLAHIENVFSTILT